MFSALSFLRIKTQCVSSPYWVWPFPHVLFVLSYIKCEAHSWNVEKTKQGCSSLRLENKTLQILTLNLFALLWRELLILANWASSQKKFVSFLKTQLQDFKPWKTANIYHFLKNLWSYSKHFENASSVISLESCTLEMSFIEDRHLFSFKENHAFLLYMFYIYKYILLDIWF